jgi:hypothetical protein
MRKTRKLLMEANPVPERGTDELSERAQRELADLTGVPAGSPPIEHPAKSTHIRPGRRRWVPAVAAVAVVLIGLGVGTVVLLNRDGPPPSTSDEPYFSSTETLEGRADAIVRGTITQATDDDRNGSPETVATVDVRSVAKGSPVPGQPLRISYTTPGSGPESAGLKVHGEYVLLLELDPSGPAHLVNSTQGWFRVDGGKAVAAPDNDVYLSPAVLTSLGLSG